MTIATSERSARGTLVSNVQIAFALLLVVAAQSAIFFALPRGFDLSDEGYYLLINRNPEQYPRVNLFGFAYRPVFELLGYDIAALRLFGHVVLIGLSLLLFRRVLVQLDGAYAGWNRTQSAILLVVLASSAIVFYRVWLLTPNYNTLNLYGALLVAAGLVPRLGPGTPQASLQSARSLVVDGVMIAVGMTLCFLAKPPTAALLTFIVLLVCVGSWRNIQFACAALAGAAILTAATLLAIDHTPSAIVARYVNSRALQLSLQSGHDVASLVSSLDPGWLWRNIRLVSTSLAFAGALVVAARAGQRPMVRPMAVVASLGIVAFAAIWMWTAPAALALPLLAVACVAWRLLSSDNETTRPVAWGLLRVAAVLMVFPFALGFGSNIPISHTSGLYAVFWVAGTLLIAGALLRGAMARNLIAATAFAAAIVSAGVVAGSVAEPYRLATPIWGQTDRVAIRDSDLRLDRQAARYLQTLKQAALDNGFADGTPMIDLTGRSPGTLYALGARPLGAAWLLGGYPGSIEFAVRALTSAPRAELERAWVLTAPDGRRAVDPATAAPRLGLPFPQGYVEVGRATVVGYNSEVHVLWKPAR